MNTDNSIQFKLSIPIASIYFQLQKCEPGNVLQPASRLLWSINWLDCYDTLKLNFVGSTPSISDANVPYSQVVYKKVFLRD